MAQKVEVVLTCDLDEGDVPAAETVLFSYDGQTYEFELCDDHLAEFRRVMEGWTASARAVSGRRHTRRTEGTGRSRAGRSSTNPSELAAMREWARAHGFEVSDRGRISTEVRQAYEAAQR